MSGAGCGERGSADDDLGGGLKAEWKATRLGDVCEFKGGGTPSKAVERYWHGDILWVSPKDMKSQVVLDSIDRITSEAVSASATAMIDPGSILMVVRSGILARTVPIAVAGRSLAMNQDLKALCPRPSIDSWFLYYLLESKMSVLLSLVSLGATVHRLITNQIRAVEFMLPPLPEQRRIVAILDEAFACIATAKANAAKSLQNTRELRESRVESTFAVRGAGWIERPLETVANIVNGYAFKSTDFQSTPGAKSIKITNVGVREFVAGVGNFLPSAFANKFAAVAVSKGSIAVALTRTIIAGGLKVAIVPDEFDGALINQRVAAIQPRSGELATSFLFEYLSTRRVSAYVNSRVNTLMQPNLSIADLRSLPVPAPTLFEQQACMEYLARFQSETQVLEAVYQRKLAALDELKKSLLHQAFSGAL